MDPDLRVFFVQRRRVWRNTLAAWELRVTYRRDKERLGEEVRPYKRHRLENPVRSYAVST